MYPNRKTMRVLEVMRTMPNRWVDIMEVAHLADLTSRQVSASIGSLPEGMIKKERNKQIGTVQVRIDGTDDELDALIIDIKSTAFGITPEIKSDIYDSCSDWITIDQIVDITGIDRYKVSKAIQLMNNIKTKSVNKVLYCCKKE